MYQNNYIVGEILEKLNIGSGLRPHSERKEDDRAPFLNDK